MNSHYKYIERFLTVFHGIIAVGVASKQETFTDPETWSQLWMYVCPGVAIIFYEKYYDFALPFWTLTLQNAFVILQSSISS